MNFPDFIGNNELKKKLSASADSGQLSHAYIISGPVGSGKSRLSRILSAAMLCGGENVPCLACSDCRKVFGGIHPDVLLVDSDKKQIPVEKIRDIGADAYILPNEAKKKVYIIPDAERLNASGQNAMLKLLEEPPAWAAFILEAGNPGALLPTVRSRCVELVIEPLSENEVLRWLREHYPDSKGLEAAAHESGGSIGKAVALLDTKADSLADDFLRALQNPLELAAFPAVLEKKSREEWDSFLNRLLVICLDMLKGKNLIKLSGRGIMELMDLAQRLLELLEGNIGVGHLGGLLVVESREIMRKHGEE